MVDLRSSNGGGVGDPVSDKAWPEENKLEEEPSDCREKPLTGDETQGY